VRSFTHANTLWLDKRADHMPEKRLLSEEGVTYSFEESVRCVSDVDTLCCFDEAISCSAQLLRRPLRGATYHPGCREGR
jgi:hypothetical protein